MSKLQNLKNELKSDILNNHGYISKQVLMTLLATNRTMRNRNEISNDRLEMLDQAIMLIWMETFDTEIEIISNF